MKLFLTMTGPFSVYGSIVDAQGRADFDDGMSIADILDRLGIGQHTACLVVHNNQAVVAGNIAGCIPSDGDSLTITPPLKAG